MPIYEYECETCGHTFEVQAKVGGPNPPCPNLFQQNPTCPKEIEGVLEVMERVTAESPSASIFVDATFPCGGKTRKLISRTSFQLLGGGWEADGYSSGGETG